MLKKLNEKLVDEGHDTDLDGEGIYLPKYDIDILQDENNIIIAPAKEQPIVTPNIDEAVRQVNDYVKVNGLEEEFDKNNYNYKKSDAKQFTIGDYRVYVEDGKICLEGFDGALEVYVNVNQIVGALQSKLLGEK